MGAPNLQELKMMDEIAGLENELKAFCLG